MRVAIMFLLHFFVNREILLIFNLCNFLVDTAQNAIFTLFTFLRLTQFSCTEIGNFVDDFMPLNKIRNFHTLRWTTFLTIFCFWIWFCVLNKIHNFYRVEILHFPVQYNFFLFKWIVPMLSFVKNNKNPKIIKKLTCAKLPRQQWYQKCLIVFTVLFVNCVCVLHACACVHAYVSVRWWWHVWRHVT